MQEQLRIYDSNPFLPEESVQVIIEPGVYDRYKSKVVLKHPTIQDLDETLFYNTQYTDQFDGCHIFIDNHLQLECKKLSELQRDNYFAENNYMYNKQNLYHGSNTDEIDFQNLRFLDIQPPIEENQGNMKSNVYDFATFFPMTSEEYITVKQQMIIKIDVNDEVYSCCTINNANDAETNNVIENVPMENENMQLEFLMVELKFVDETKIPVETKQQVIQQEFATADVNYFIQCLENENIYSIIFSLQETNESQITIGDEVQPDLQFFIDEQQIINAYSVHDVIEQFNQYKNNVAPVYNLNLKEAINQPLNIFIHKTGVTPVYVTYYKNIAE